MPTRRRAATRPVVTLAATVALLGAQPAVLCGALCLAAHTPAAPVSQHHHGSPEAPCHGGQVVVADGMSVELHAAGATLPAAPALDVPTLDERGVDTGLAPRRAIPPPPDLQDPPPRG